MGKGAAIKDMKDPYDHFNLTSELFFKRKYLKLKITNFKTTKIRNPSVLCIISPWRNIWYVEIDNDL